MSEPKVVKQWVLHEIQNIPAGQVGDSQNIQTKIVRKEKTWPNSCQRSCKTACSYAALKGNQKTMATFW